MWSDQILDLISEAVIGLSGDPTNKKIRKYNNIIFLWLFLLKYSKKNAPKNNIPVKTLDKLSIWLVGWLWWLMTFSTIYQLYRGGQFYCWRKPEYPVKTKPVVSHWQTLSRNVVSSTPRLRRIRTHNVSGDRHWLHR